MLIVMASSKIEDNLATKKLKWKLLNNLTIEELTFLKLVTAILWQPNYLLGETSPIKLYPIQIHLNFYVHVAVLWANPKRGTKFGEMRLFNDADSPNQFPFIIK